MSYTVEAITNRNEAQKKLAEHKIEKFEFISDNTGIARGSQFFSHDGEVTIKGRSYDFNSKTGKRDWETGDDVDEILDDSWLIPGLHCPDCGAQAYKTDKPNIATCGAYAGWYFFYSDIKSEDEGGSGNKIVMKYVNGVLTPVLEQSTGVTVGEVRT